MTGIDSPGNASTLSILIDESGDMYAPYRIGSMTDRYYLFALVLHDQTNQMQFPDFRTFDERIRSLNSSFGIDPDAPIHTGNLIRREKPYRRLDIRSRIELFDALVGFVGTCISSPVEVHVVETDRSRHLYIEEEPPSISVPDVKAELREKLAWLIEERRSFCEGYDSIKIYYDNGQKPLADILHRALDNAFPNGVQLEYKSSVRQTKYRLLQVTDLFCTMRLLTLKASVGCLSRSEISFFGGRAGSLHHAEARIRRINEILRPLTGRIEERRSRSSASPGEDRSIQDGSQS